MKTLINSEEVLELAFSPDEPVNSSMITTADIAEAEYSHLRPIVGDALLEALHDGAYPTLMEEYVAPMLAAWTHFIVRPMLGLRSSTCVATESPHTLTAAENSYRERVQSILHHKATTLSRRLSDHLNSHRDEYDEYKPYKNLLNRYYNYGGVIQTR